MERVVFIRGKGKYQVTIEQRLLKELAGHCKEFEQESS